MLRAHFYHRGNVANAIIFNFAMEALNDQGNASVKLHDREGHSVDTTSEKCSGRERTNSQ